MTETSSTVRQCIALLEVLSHSSHRRPAELAEKLRMNRSSVQRLLNTLEGRGLIVKTVEGYSLDTYMRVISDRTLPTLRGAAFNVVRALADDTHETVALYVVDGDRVVVLDEVPARADSTLRVRHPVGSRVEMLTSSPGRAIAAFAPPELRRRLPGRALNAGLERVQAQGIAAGEAFGGLVADIASPILDRRGYAIASVAVLVPQVRAANVSSLTEGLLASAQRIGDRWRTEDERR